MNDENPTEKRDAAPRRPGETTPGEIVERYVAMKAEREAQLAVVDAFVATYLEIIRDIAAEFRRMAPETIPVATDFICNPERTRCIQKLRFDGLLFNFVHLREVAYFSFAPVPDEIAGQVALYVQEFPATPGASLGDGHLISTMFIYPVRREWRFLWGLSAGALYTFEDTMQLRDKVLRDIRSVITGSAGSRRWPEMEAIARIPAEVLEIKKTDEEHSIGFLRPSLKVPRTLSVPATPQEEKTAARLRS
jgi:hypothetical protein